MKLVAEVLGQGPDLVLLPGWAMPASAMRPWAQSLATQWRVWLLDLPGQGDCRETWPALGQLAERLAESLPAQAVWAGWSLGGQLLLAAAACRRPAGLLLLATSPRFCAFEAWAGVAPERLQAMRDALPSAPQQVLLQFLSLLSSRGDGARAAGHRLRRLLALQPSDIDALQAGLAALADLDLRADLPCLDFPCRWVSGSDDPLVPVESVEWAAAQMPQGQSCILSGAGHMPFLTHAAAVDAELAALRYQVNL